MPQKHDVHVSPDRDHGYWKTTQGGATIASHLTHAEAFKIGERESRHDGVDLIIHERDGRIRSKDSYGNDPKPPRDREHC